MKKNNKKINIRNIAIVFLLVFFSFSSVAIASEINISNIIKLVNDSRVSQGVGELVENKTLDKIASDKLADMIKNDYFAHTSPAGINPWFWYEKDGYDYKYAGENLAINFLKAEDQHKAWMASPTHRKNILNDKYQEIGVAVDAGKINGQMAIIAVQEFGARDGAAAIPPDGKNFSGQGNENTLKDIGNKPQVLSMKDLSGKNLQNEPVNISHDLNFFRSLADGLGENQFAISEFMSTLAFLMLLFSMLLSSVSFMAVAGHEILVAEELRKKSLAEALSIEDQKNILAAR